MTRHALRQPVAFTLAVLFMLVAGIASAQGTDPIVAIDSPAEGQHVVGIVPIAGWAAHTAATTGTGVDALDVYLDGPSGVGEFLGRTQYGAPRADVGTYLGNARFTPSGFGFAWNAASLGAGVHRLYIYVHSTVTGWSLLTRTVVSTTVPAKMHPLTVTMTGSGTGSATNYRSGTIFRTGMPGPTVEYYPEGTLVKVGALADGGSSFASWDGDCATTSNQPIGLSEATSTNPTCTITMSEGKIVSATMTALAAGARTFPLTVIVTGTGAGSVATGLTGAEARSGPAATVIPLIEGASITLTPKPGAGSTSGGFTEGCDGQTSVGVGGIERGLGSDAAVATCTVQMSGPKTVRVAFNAAAGKRLARLTLKFGGVGGGSVTVVTRSGLLELYREEIRFGLGDVDSSKDTAISNDGDYSYGLTARPDPGSKFVGWGGDLVCTVETVAPCRVSIPHSSPTEQPQPVGVTATFASIDADMVPLTLILDNDTGSGSFEGNLVGVVGRTGMQPKVHVLPKGTRVTLTSQPDFEWVAPEWTGACQGPSQTCTVQMDGPKTVKLKFRATRPTFPLTVVCGGSGRGKVIVTAGGFSRATGCSPEAELDLSQWPSNEKAEVAEVPPEDLDENLLDKFGGWGGDCLAFGLGKTCKLNVTGPQTVTATFNRPSGGGYPGYAYVATAGPGGAIVLRGTASATSGAPYVFYPGSADGVTPPTVSAEASPFPGYAFGGWGRDCTGTAPTCTVTMDRNRSVTASFAKKPQISVDSPLEGANVTGAVLSIAGWVAHELPGDLAPAGGSAIDALDFYLDCQACPTGYLGRTTPNLPSPDVDTYLGGSGKYLNSRFMFQFDASNLTPGSHTLYFYIHSLVTGWSFLTRAFTIGGSATTFKLTVTNAGTGAGEVESAPPGIASFKIITSGGAGVTGSVAFNAGTVVMLTATATAGSTFAGWSGGCLGTTSPCTVTMSAHQNVTATFNTTGGQTSYNLMVTHAGTGGGTVTGVPAGISASISTSGGAGVNQTVPFNAGTVVILTATATAGSTFAGWSGGCLGTTSSCTVPMVAHQNVTATFNTTGGGQNSHNLTVAQTGTGAGTVTSTSSDASTTREISTSGTSGAASASQTETFAANEVVRLTVTPSSGSVFSGWTTVAGAAGACTGATTPCDVVMTANTTLQARFDSQGAPTPQTYALTLQHAGTGTGGVVGKSPTPPAAVTVITTSGAAGPKGNVPIGAGVIVTLMATPDVGSIFSGWTGTATTTTCTGTTSPCTVTMSANTTMTATFTQVSYTLDIGHKGTGSGTVGSVSVPAQASQIGTSGTASVPRQTVAFPAGAQVTLTATPSADSVVGAWVGGPCAGSVSSSCTFFMVANMSFDATFDLKTFTLTVTKQGQGAGTVVSNPAGINAPTVPSATFPVNQNVILSAIPAPGSLFDAWGGACAGVPKTSPCNLTVTTNLAATATFIVNPVP